MTVISNEDELNPIVQAALADDEDDTEEEKELRKQALGLEDEDDSKNTDEDADNDKASDNQNDDEDDEQDPPDDGEEGNEDSDQDSSDEEEQLSKPQEAQDDDDEDVPTRKERREARKEQYDDIYKPGRQPQQQRQNIDYKPLDYSQADEFKPEDLQTDREKYGQVQYIKGAEEVKYWAEQENFFKELDYENRILTADPEMSFLSPQKPSGEKNPNFDERKAEDINNLYLNMIGYREHYRTDSNGNVLIGRDGQPETYATVERTDISYEKFARREVNRMKSWSNDEASEIAENKFKNLKKQNKNRSVRPSGQRKRRIGELSPGMISKMSDEDLEKYEEEIDAQINRELGL